MESIDLNCDMGESPGHVADGTQEALMAHLTSVNIACGAHAGNEEMMRATIRQALRWKVAAGAHPGYPDQENFGRIALEMPVADVEQSVFEQILTLARIAHECGTALAHVKPHGALYNSGAKDAALAAAIAAGVRRFSRSLVVVGLAGSRMLDVFRDAGLPVAAEAFADRRYEPDGTLRPRTFEDALIRDPEEAARQAAGIACDACVTASDGSKIAVVAETICIHGDTPGAPRIAAAVAARLRECGVRLAPLAAIRGPAPGAGNRRKRC